MGLGMGTLVAQEGQFGDVIQPKSGGLSPSDAASGDRLVPPNMGEAAYFPASTVQCQPPQKSRPTWRVMLVNTAPASWEGQ
ncbi:unnamed protein product [Rangifer tarandus platyrhynchus]|uniref:Uncharacterized protein n=2 Tax=Rangifer tarandus platyrhynchus TaxID=3082113 RepID=A0ABN8Z3Y7_RANTA|nr:unnamed protein product [Rangifer tarandus platyrhynchus]CAI9704917.1 unnamed protein product [Rangifer tarandus platyrhynchus]